MIPRSKQAGPVEDQSAKKTRNQRIKKQAILCTKRSKRSDKNKLLKRKDRHSYVIRNAEEMRKEKEVISDKRQCRK
jgi:hypothetical protein